MLYLRFSTYEPNPSAKPKPLLPMTLVSDILKVPLEVLKWMERKYFSPKVSQATDITKVTVKNITPDEILFLIHNTTLYNQAILSLPKRCKMYHRQFPNRRIKPRVISKIYRYFGITMNKVKVQNIPTRLEKRTKEFEQDVLQLDNQIHKVLSKGGHLVYLDETVFKKNNYTRQAYSNHKQNLKVFNRLQNQVAQAVCVAICQCYVVLAQEQREKMFIRETYMEMLESIRDAAIDDRTIYLMRDLCWIHYGEQDVDIKMKELNIVPIMNVSYRFEFNPCERLFAIWKQKYRLVLLDKMLKDPAPKDQPMKEAMSEVFHMLNQSYPKLIPKIVKKAQRILRMEANALRRQYEMEEIEDYYA